MIPPIAKALERGRILPAVCLRALLTQMAPQSHLGGTALPGRIAFPRDWLVAVRGSFCSLFFELPLVPSLAVFLALTGQEYLQSIPEGPSWTPSLSPL